ncbi:MAG TPA: ABC transporter permease [Roseiflexaceae bacterium]|nr:ABC transporter permease [Roseiflexaceae bacterium]
MAGRILSIALLYLRVTSRRRAVLVQMLLVPLLLTFVLGQALGEDATESAAVRVAVVNADTGPLGGELAGLLERAGQLRVVPADRAAALAALHDGSAEAALFIPADFSARLGAGEAPPIEYTGLSTASGPLTRQAVALALERFNSALAAAESAARTASPGGPPAADLLLRARQAALAQWRDAPPIAVAAAPGAVPAIGPSGMAHSSPGLLVMFAMFFALGGGMTLLQERDGGTLRRLLVMPCTRAELLGGKLLGIFLTSLAQMGILIAAGVLLFGVQWGQSPLGLALLVPAYALTVTAFSIALAAAVRTVAQLQAISVLLVMVLSALGGAWWPLEVVPAWLRAVGLLTPTFWAVDGFQDLITRGLGAEAVLPNIAALLAFAAAFMLLGVRRFRYE